MLDLPILSNEIGAEAAQRLATAYESALLVLSSSQLSRMPDRSTRLHLVEAMITQGRVSGFEPEIMTEAGIAAVGRGVA